MDNKKLVKGKEYYCLVGERWFASLAIVKVTYIGSYNYPYNDNLVSVEQDIDGFKSQFGIDAGHLYPLDKRVISAVLHNDRQSRRIIEHPKTYNIKNAKTLIFGWIDTLLEADRKALMIGVRKERPELVSADGKYLTSKFKMNDWDGLMRGYFAFKYTKVEVPDFE